MELKKGALMVNALVKFGAGFLIIGLLLFGCAGTLRYTQGWIFLAALLIPMLLFGAVLLVKAPETLARRLKGKEPDKSQRANAAVSGVVFLSTFALAGLDHRFGWSRAPGAVTNVALAVMLFGYGLFVAVITQNAYASRVVEVTEGQTVITTGLYAVVRHPMYTAALILFFAMPFVLGSYPAALPMVVTLCSIVRRIMGEEAMLSEELRGYREYMQITRYRLVPFVW